VCSWIVLDNLKVVNLHVGIRSHLCQSLLFVLIARVCEFFSWKIDYFLNLDGHLLILYFLDLNNPILEDNLLHFDNSFHVSIDIDDSLNFDWLLHLYDLFNVDINYLLNLHYLIDLDYFLHLYYLFHNDVPDNLDVLLHLPLYELLDYYLFGDLFDYQLLH
jgi:hypothetical protein